MELLEARIAERRDRMLRWIAVGALLLLTQVVSIIVSLEEGFFDPWLFAMLAAPALGVATGILARQFLQVVIVRYESKPMRRLVLVMLSGERHSP